MKLEEFLASPFGVKFCITHDEHNRDGMLNIYKPQFITVPLQENAEIEILHEGNRARIDTPAIVINLDLAAGTTHCTVFQPNNVAPELLEALVRISEGAGRYDLDPLQHAANCIEDMKALALEAIKKATELKG